MRCSSCQRFVSFEEDEEPEVEVSLSQDGKVTASVRIVNSCAECGQELCDAHFELVGSVSLAKFRGHVCLDEKPLPGVPEAESIPILEADEEEVERTSRTEGKGRGMRTYNGVKVTVRVKCGCGECQDVVEMSDEVSASEMEECQ